MLRVVWIYSFVCVCVCSHHVYQLCDREAELDDNHVGGVPRRTRPLAVAPEQPPEEIVLSVGPVVRQHWRKETVRRGRLSLQTRETSNFYFILFYLWSLVTIYKSFIKAA